MKKSNIIHLKINGWEKHQHKNGTKTFDWFKIYNTLFDDPHIQQLTPTGFKLFIYLLTIASRYRTGNISVDLSYVARSTSIRHRYVTRSVDDLERYHIVTRVSGTQNRIEEKEENTCDLGTPDQQTLDFETLYQLYPAKRGKTVGIKRCKAKIKTEKDYANLKKAIENYAREVRVKKTEKEYIKHFSTFMTQWEDYLELEHKESPPLSWGSLDA